MQHALIRIKRRRELADLLRSYRVIVDGARAARIRRGQTLELSLPPGPHRIVLRVDWARSNYLELDCRAGEVREFECGSNISGMRVFLAAIYILFFPHRYLWIRQVRRDHPAMVPPERGIPVMPPATDRPRLF